MIYKYLLLSLIRSADYLENMEEIQGPYLASALHDKVGSTFGVYGGNTGTMIYLLLSMIRSAQILEYNREIQGPDLAPALHDKAGSILEYNREIQGPDLVPALQDKVNSDLYSSKEMYQQYEIDHRVWTRL